MPRTARKAPPGVVFHVLNRGVGRRDLFEKDQDFAAFERVLAHALEQVPVDLFAYCIMSNHDSTERSPKSGICCCARALRDSLDSSCIA
jgi:hypothetical protein